MRRDWTEAKAKCKEEGVCRNCKRNSHLLQPAHLVHRGMGGGMEADNIIPLCQGCHSQFDRHDLDILGLLSLDEQLTMVRNAGGIENARRRACPNQYRDTPTP